MGDGQQKVIRINSWLAVGHLKLGHTFLWAALTTALASGFCYYIDAANMGWGFGLIFFAISFGCWFVCNNRVIIGRKPSRFWNTYLERLLAPVLVLITSLFNLLFLEHSGWRLVFWVFLGCGGLLLLALQFRTIRMDRRRLQEQLQSAVPGRRDGEGSTQ